MDRPIVAFDTETATLRGAPHLLELAAVRAVDGDVVDRFEALVRPEVAIDPAATEVHGLRDADVRDAAPAGEVLRRFVAWLGMDWLAAHDARFDAAVLAFEGHRHGVELPDTPILDTLRLARRWIDDAPDHKLETLVGHLDLEVDAAHRALPDAVACWLVLEECRARAALAVETGQAARVWWPEACALAGRTTFRTSGPRSPRLRPRLRALEAACRERASVTLHYGDPGSAVARIAVAPRLLFATAQRAYLEGECLRSATIKTYRLDRIQAIEGR